MFFLLPKALVTPCLVFSIGIKIFSAVRNWHAMCMCYSNTISTHTLPPKKNEWNKLMAPSQQNSLPWILIRCWGKKKHKICPKWWCKMVNYYSRVRKLTWQPLENHQYLLGNTSSNGCFFSCYVSFWNQEPRVPANIMHVKKSTWNMPSHFLGSKVAQSGKFPRRNPTKLVGFEHHTKALNDSDLPKDTVVGKKIKKLSSNCGFMMITMMIYYGRK